MSFSPACTRGCKNQEKHRAPDSGRPNVLLITIDTLRADHMSLHGRSPRTSPFLDRFARKGIYFTHAETPVTITLPAHASIMSSLYPRQHGAVGNYWQVKDAPMLAEVLADQGYQTGAVIANWVLNHKTFIDQGFENFMDEPPPELIKKHPEQDKWEIAWDRTADQVLPLAKQYILSADPDRPWLLWVHLWDTHWPYQCDRSLREQFKIDDLPAEFEVPEKWLDHALKLNSWYDCSILTLDRKLEDFFDWMDETGYLDFTLVIITSDHGEGLYEHGENLHGRKVYETTTWVPLIIRLPKNRHGGQSFTESVTLLDIAPTIYEFIGITGPRRMAGISLMPAIRGEQPLPPRPIILTRSWFSKTRPENEDYWEPGETFAALDGQFKYIWHSDLDDELYDLDQDPRELVNLVNQEPEREASFQELIDRHREQVGPRPTERPPISPAVKDHLRDLGYIEGD